ncbi:MAG TPA: hypothetical protein VGQ93_10590 [Lysobacter sp.]|nr:hypothetical protein [Lysobacter sp.]
MTRVRVATAAIWCRITATALATAIAASPVYGSEEKAKEGNRVERTAKKAANATERTAKRAGKFVEKTATRAGKAVSRTAEKTGNWVRKQTE